MTEKVGKIVRQRLRDLGKGQGWLAEELGVSINAVSKWCRTGHISRGNIPKVAEKLQLSVAELVGDVSTVTHIKPKGAVELGVMDNLAVSTVEENRERTTLQRLDAQEAELLRFFRESSDEAQEILMSHARLLAKASGR